MRLESNQFTGVLSPLADTSFFNQAFVDSGAVAWPGEIDLAPDAMYAVIAAQRSMEPQLDARPQPWVVPE